jgi:hypothetical protein
LIVSQTKEEEEEEKEETHTCQTSVQQDKEVKL